MHPVKYQILDRPARKLILKRSRADHYMDYVKEIGCGEKNNSAAWDVLENVRDAMFEPVGLWLPASLQTENTGSYAHGVEIPITYTWPIPDGFEEITLPPCKYIVFLGEPYAEEDAESAIAQTMEQIRQFDPAEHGYAYAPDTGPKMQLQPQCSRGYIELWPVTAL